MTIHFIWLQKNTIYVINKNEIQYYLKIENQKTITISIK